jgi:hypothetical protein
MCLKEVPLTSQLVDEEQAVAVIDRIMAHKDGNLDLTKEPASKR